MCYVIVFVSKGAQPYYVTQNKDLTNGFAFYYKFYPFCTELQAYTIYLGIRIMLRSLLLISNKKLMIELCPCKE